MSLPEISWDTRYAAEFRKHGWHGFVPLGPAVEGRHEFLRERREQLKPSGVYAVFAPPAWEPAWITVPPELPNVIEPWTDAQLRERWIDGVELTYIGCAGTTPASQSLYQRVKELLRHGAGKISDRGPHKGGERLWQCLGWETSRWRGR